MNAKMAEIRRGARLRLLVVGALALGAFLLAAAAAEAGSDERKGTGGANELRIPVGPRGVALGGSAIADASGVEAIFWNPAGLAVLDGTEAMFSYTSYYADMDLNYAAVATSIGGFGTLAFNAKVLSIGDIIVTTEDAPEGTGEILSPTFSVLGVSFARRFTDRVLFGATLNYVNEKILNVTANGVALDLGVQYFTGWNGLKFGVTMKNFGPDMKFDGENFEANFQPPDSDPQSSNRTFRSSSSRFEMPSYFILGASYDLYSNVDHRFAVIGAFQNNNFVGDNVRGGAEWNYRDIVSLRGSYYASFQRQNVNITTGEGDTEINGGDDVFNGFALGGGVHVPLGSGGTRLGVDVAWRSVREFFDDTVEVGATLGF